MATTVDIVIPVLNEEVALSNSVEKLFAFTAEYPERDWRIMIADNGSTDQTREIAEGLAEKHSNILVSLLDQRGRGRALKKAWGESDADVRLYMDVDLSTDLKALPPLVAAIAEDGYDVAIGSRLIKGSEVVDRTLKREITSRGYNILIHMFFPLTKWKDAQCGFKAISRRTAENVLPLVKDNAWFLDTELLLLAGKAGYGIKEVPVHWEDDPDTRVKIISTAWEDVKGLLRLRFKGRPVPPSTT
ncbi:MAG TPA: dolichyl-phosphate beta-glucosyltransferase [Dehalococcoidia bacterium]|nr:glycosyl transferase [Chloroflexota bacterium]MDP6056264.1 glycosyltransferase family 2 protein [Dehalococcoidia bacterium]MDP7089670.1 glycosyltransferase family 2 protein [Dehalococcoidia bacterium]MDP7485104.1 glycosyltransferase family 2 protein [Dehalococcoidia bacterium]HJP27355.1 dolichyl-phosphate beta-glucosyltransferase [Dehalococcoidia bacterium]